MWHGRAIPALICLIALGLIPATDAGAGPADGEIRYLTGSAFRRELQQPITIARSDVELRPLLRRLAAERQAAILLDRRIDPSTEVDANIAPTRLEEALRRIAVQAGGAVSVVGDTVYIGPRRSAGALRTLVALRVSEIDGFAEGSGRREFDLARPHTFVWNDLERPADLVLRIAQRYGLAVEGLELIPHDLWAASVISGATAVEALSLVLIQFDLTFSWIDEGRGIRLEPAPQRATVTRTHTIRRTTPQRARAALLERFPELEFEFRGRSFDVAATVEQHEAIAVLARGGRLEDEDEPDVDFGPLARRRFTLRVVRQPVLAVLETLQAGGVTIEYDRDALTAMGIDLSEKVSLELRDATVAELFQSLCKPVGLEFHVAGDVVTLSPAK